MQFFLNLSAGLPSILNPLFLVLGQCAT